MSLSATEYYSAMKSKPPVSATTWTHLENVTLSDRARHRGHTARDPLIGNVQNCKPTGQEDEWGLGDGRFWTQTEGEVTQPRHGAKATALCTIK